MTGPSLETSNPLVKNFLIQPLEISCCNVDVQIDTQAQRRARLKTLIDELAAGSITDFAKKYSYSKAQISQYLSPTYNGGNSMGERVVAEIEKRTQRPGWFTEATALGEPKPDAYFGGLTTIRTWDHEDELPPGEYAFIARLEVRLGAGPGKDQIELELTKDQPQAFRTDWIRKKRLKPSKLASMIASGDSMEPRIYDGDAVVVDTSQTDIVDGKVYALWYDGGERVKRLYRRPGGSLLVHSDNKDKHPPFTLSPGEAEHVRIIGRVVHVAGDGGL